MCRFSFLGIAVVFLPVGYGAGDEPRTIVLADRATADLLPSLRRSVDVEVLIQDDNEPDYLVERRALKLRSARHYVYRSTQETPLSALYRERLTAQGVLPIDIDLCLRYQTTVPSANFFKVIGGTLGKLVKGP